MAKLEDAQDHGMHDDWIYDLSNRPALIIQVSPETSSEDLDTFEQELRSLAASVPQRDDAAPPQVGRYQIGSAAEWSYTFAIAWDAVQQTPDYFAQAVDWAIRFDFLFGRLKPTAPEALRDEMGNERESFSIQPMELGITPSVVINLVMSHFQASYGALDKLKLSWFVRGSRYGADLSQPTGDELYTMDIHDVSSHYIYVVTGTGIPVEHFLVSSGRLHPLEEPKWLGREPSNTFEVLDSGFRQL